MRITVTNLQGKQVQKFSFARVEIKGGEVVVTNRNGKNHHFPITGSIVMSREDPRGLSGLLSRMMIR